MMKLCSLVVCVSVLFHLTQANPPIGCHRGPYGTQVPKTPGDGSYKIKISGNPQNYVPGEVYTVSIQGHRDQYTVRKFTGFMLMVVATTPPQIHNGNFGLQSVGTFQLYGDVLTMHSEDCPNAVIQTSHIHKSEIQVLWTAPPAGSGCLQFKASVEEQRDLWYLDDGQLTKELCEEVQESDDFQPEVIYDCCACDEAKYEVTFEGLWSRQTHPKDFPANEWLTHFSDIIGASHSNDYRVWEYGGYASDGLRQVAEWGSTRTLESELKRQSDHIRTIIKARGLWYPNVNGKTFAVFRVDNRHHLMSLVSMLGPSPDWIVGVSALELCTRDCSWVESKSLNLYPWDAGTDSGVTYMASNTPSIPREKIRRISNSSPNNPKSPFYDPKGLPMKPLARLTISRQRVYEKSCSDTGSIGEEDQPYGQSEDDDASRPECAVSEWSEMTACSVTCGKGLIMRTRFYRSPMKADMFRCHRQLEETEMCAAPVPYCEGGSHDSIFGGKQYQLEDPVCATTEWSTWSTCTVTCGNGFQMRTRRYLDRMGRKKCSKELTQKQVCAGEAIHCEDEVEEEVPPGCEATQWTNWSPCSVTCAKGVRVRTRYFLVPTASQKTCPIKTIDKTMCEGERRDCTLDKAEAKEVCLQERLVGPCRGHYPRWYYDTTKRLCMQFIYGGCRGNRNNFEGYDECTRMCEFARDSLHGIGDPNNNVVDQYAPSVIQNRHNQQYGQSQNPYGQSQKTYGYSQSPFGRSRSPFGNSQSPFGNSQSPFGKSPAVSTQYRNPYNQGQVENDRSAIHGGGGGGGDNFNSVVFGPTSHYDPSYSTQANSIQPEYATGLRSENQLGPKQNCIVSSWGNWSPCSVTCGKGWKNMKRVISAEPQNGGRPCPKKLQRQQKCKPGRCNPDNNHNLESLSSVFDPHSEAEDYGVDYDQGGETANRYGNLSIATSYVPTNINSHLNKDAETIFTGNDDCTMSEWGEWSPCTQTCGTEALQQRVRKIVTAARDGGIPCGPRLERRYCALKSCPKKYIAPDNKRPLGAWVY